MLSVAVEKRGTLTLAALMLGVCYFGTTTAIPKARVAGWIGLVLFSLGTVLTVMRMFQCDVSLIVDAVWAHIQALHPELTNS
jgi:hypothetical protein